MHHHGAGLGLCWLHDAVATAVVIASQVAAIVAGHAVLAAAVGHCIVVAGNPVAGIADGTICQSAAVSGAVDEGGVVAGARILVACCFARIGFAGCPAAAVSLVAPGEQCITVVPAVLGGAKCQQLLKGVRGCP